MFIDEATISVRAGNGGSGVVAFRREKYVPKGGPDGGDGGDGGDVVMVADPQLSSLLDFQYTRTYSAEDGRPGGKNCRTGKSGKSTRIRVPVGTVVRDVDTSEVLVDLHGPRQEFIVAFGGSAGRGNAAFKSPTRQTPRFCEKGEPGEQRRVSLELKLLADVGLVGLPNAGKSSLLARVSAARPKIADYPFTTLVPNLGVYRIDRDSTLVLADIPGLIEGAHDGVGLGDAFLKHIERTRLIIHLLDISLFERPDPLADFDTISHELLASGRGLDQLPRIVALNKIDIAAADAVDQVASRIAEQGHEMFRISAATGQGVDELMACVGHRVTSIRASIPAQPEPEPIQRQRRQRREHTPIRVARCDDGGFVVSGTAPEEAVARLNLDSEGGLLRLQELLSEMGVLNALERRGAAEGDTVRIGAIEFDYTNAASVFDEYM